MLLPTDMHMYINIHSAYFFMPISSTSNFDALHKSMCMARHVTRKRIESINNSQLLTPRPLRMLFVCLFVFFSFFLRQPFVDSKR